MPVGTPADPTPPTDPDGLAVFQVLAQRRPPSAVEAYNAVQGDRNMSGQTLAAEIRSAQQSTAAKIDAQNARFDAQNARFDALQTEIRGQRAVIWTLIAILGAAAVVGLSALIAQALK